MSVIVKGMKMPDCCVDCPIYNGEYGMLNLLPDSYSYNDDGEERYDPFEEREEDCPLESYKENEE